MENHLKHLEKFREVLNKYQISPHGKKILGEVKFVALSGLSSSGRNTVMRELIKTGLYHFIISDTTRKPRINDGVLERNGVEYWFKSEEEMLGSLQAGEMLEAEIIHAQQVSGISISELEKAKDEDKIAITDMEIGGFKNILREKPDTTAVILLPPSFVEWQKRMDARGQMPADEKKRRLTTALEVLNSALSMKTVSIVINHDFHQTVRVFAELQTHSVDQSEARLVAQSLLEETQKFLDY